MSEVELERMVVRIVGDATSYQKMMRSAETTTKQVSNSISTSSDRFQFASRRLHVLGLTFRGFGANAAAAALPILGVAGGAASLFKGVSLAADAEMLESNFEVMLGSAEAAKKMVTDLQTFAAKTPLNMGDLQRFTKMLLQAGVAGDEILPTLKSLGDAALGDAGKLQGLAYAFGQVKTFGRLMGGELIQLRNAGFDPLAEISRTTGRSMGDLRKDMERGLISFDMVKEAFNTATSEGGRFANGMEKASTTLSGLFSTMQDDMDATLRTIGKMLIEELGMKEVLKAVSSGVQFITEFIASIPKELKQTIVSFAAGAAAVVAFVAALLVLKGIFAVILPLLIGFAPHIIVIGLIAAAVGDLVNEMGGIAGVIEYVKTKLGELWEWLRPIRRALESLGNAVTEQIRMAWSSLKDSLLSIWKSLAGDTSVDWNRIRDGALTAIIAIEFAARNLEKVFNVVWLGIQLGAVSLVNELLRNIFLVALVAAFPPLLGVFLINWKETFTAVWEVVKSVGKSILDFWTGVFKAMFTLMFGLGDKIGDILRGKIKISDIFREAMWEVGREIGPRLGKIKVNWKGIEFNELIDLEAALRKEFDAAAGALGADWEAFRAKKLAEFGLPANLPALEEKAEDTGRKTGAAMNKGLGKEMGKFDAALFNSAEALGRVADYKARLAAGTAAVTDVPGAMAPGANPAGVPAAKVAAALGDTDRVAVILEDIRDELRDRDEVVIGVADLGTA